MADPDIDALLGPTLERGPCCARETVALRRQIVGVLNSDACQEMSFRAGGIHVSGFMYRVVGFGLDGDQHSYHVSVDPDMPKLEGRFDPGQSRFTFRFGAISLDPKRMAQNCETIVHECTHACIAMTGKTVASDLNEVLAWFGGVLYLRGQGLAIGGFGEFRDNLRALADDARKANARGRVFDMPPDAVAALAKDIRLGYRH